MNVYSAKLKNIADELKVIFEKSRVNCDNCNKEIKLSEAIVFDEKILCVVCFSKELNEIGDLDDQI